MKIYYFSSLFSIVKMIGTSLLQKARLLVDSKGIGGLFVVLLKKLIAKAVVRRPASLLSVAEKYNCEDTRNSLCGLTSEERQMAALKNLLSYTKSGGKTYSATKYPAGYHTIEVLGERLAGQRDPKMRLDSVPFDFSGRTVLDIGCNQGGMLFEVSDQIKWGVGIDYDTKMVNVCNKIAQIQNSRHITFYTFDIDRDNHLLIEDFLPSEKVDIVFLLSVCMWVSEWRSLIDLCSNISEVLLFESNGTPQLQEKQFSYLQSKYKEIVLIRERSNDDELQSNRRLYLAHTKMQ